MSDCDAEKPPAGVIQFYNTSSQPDDKEQRLSEIFEQWINKQINVDVSNTSNSQYY